MQSDTRYDYLIVGAGSAGAILAARLTEDPKTTVLLLEAGPDYRSADAPAEMRSANALAIMDSQRFPTYHWPDLLARRTARQEPYPYTRGRGLGGSSAINSQMAHRAPLEDFDHWAEQGCAGWSGEELLPAMNRLETDVDFGDAPYHGRSGPVTIRRVPIARWGNVDLALLQAALDLGHPWHSDLNAPDSTGVCGCPTNRTADNRVSTNDGYLEPARGRPNLTILGDTHVDRVLFDGQRVSGVRAHGSNGWTEYSGTDTIISAGALMSPAILLRSGIGPAAQLREFGLPVYADLPVGRNLRDHPAVWFRLALRPEARALAGQEWNVNCIVRYSSRLAGAGANDMLIAGLNDDGLDEAGLAVGSLGLSAWQAFSAGTLELADPDPFTPPRINEQLLSDARDMERMRDGTRRVLAITQHPALRAIGDGVTVAPMVAGEPPLAIEELADDTTLDAWLLATVADVFHITGTCRMGAPDDPRTVVDPDCRVLGVDGLRVIDGSIMPDVTRSNTNLPIMAIAEHMAARLQRAR